VASGVFNDRHMGFRRVGVYWFSGPRILKGSGFVDASFVRRHMDFTGSGVC